MERYHWWIGPLKRWIGHSIPMSRHIHRTRLLITIIVTMRKVPLRLVMTFTWIAIKIGVFRIALCGNEIVDASEFIGRLPYSLTDRIVLGKKDTSVYLMDWKTGKLVKRYRVDDLYTNSVVQNAEEKAVVLSNEAPVLFGSGFKDSEDLPDLVYIERKDFKVQCISKFGDVLWSVSYAEMEAKLQHHENVQRIPIRTSQGKSQLSYMTSVPVLRFRNYFEKLFPRLGVLDGALYFPFQDRKLNQLAPGKESPLALPSNEEFKEILSLVFCRLRQSKWIKEPYASEVPIVIPKKKKSKKNGYVSGWNKDPSFEDNKKKLLATFSGLVNSPADGYSVGKLFVSNKEIAKGSNGTVVLEGSYEGRLVAVKRLVQTHHDVAQKEILNLIASDKLQNIVRWYGVNQDEHFIYISLERCACSLNDLIYASSGLLENPMASSSRHEVGLWKENGHPSPVLLKLMRPKAEQVLHHTLFWNSDMRLSFRRDASDRVELENREEGSQLLAALESTATVTLNGRWDEKLDSIFIDNIGRYRRYKNYLGLYLKGLIVTSQGGSQNC